MSFYFEAFKPTTMHMKVKRDSAVLQMQEMRHEMHASRSQFEAMWEEDAVMIPAPGLKDVKKVKIAMNR